MNFDIPTQSQHTHVGCYLELKFDQIGEKWPFDDTFAKADEVGKPLFCAFNRRFDPSFASIKKRVQAGEVGHVQMIKTTSRDSPLPTIDYLKISGGIFHDCAVHDIDLVTWIVGEYPTEVST